jgi:hypothetical protein
MDIVTALGRERVRSLAHACGGIEELSYCKDKKLLCLRRTKDGTVINVFVGQQANRDAAAAQPRRWVNNTIVLHGIFDPLAKEAAVQEELAWTALQVAAEQERARKQAERIEAKEKKKKEKLRKTRGDAWIVELCADDDEDGTPDLSSDVACLAVNCDGYF